MLRFHLYARALAISPADRRSGQLAADPVLTSDIRRELGAFSRMLNF